LDCEMRGEPVRKLPYDYQKKYKESEKGKLTQKKWNCSNKKREGNKIYRNKPENKIKIKAYRLVKDLIKIGKIERKPCYVCSNKKSFAHHEDYLEPLNIIWLCVSCHNKLHKQKIMLLWELEVIP
jgi:hypothetical protein